MNEIALLVAATLNSGTVLAIAGAGPAAQRARRHRQPRGRGHDAGGRDRRLRRRVHTGSDLLAFVAGAGAGALLAAAFGVLVIWLNTNQYATGLALSLFGVGFSAFVGVGYVGQKLAERTPFEIPGLATFRSSGRRCSSSTRWSTSRSC